MLNVGLRGTAMRAELASRRKEGPQAACSVQPGVAAFVEDDVPFAALECVECEVRLVDGEIRDARSRPYLPLRGRPAVEPGQPPSTAQSATTRKRCYRWSGAGEALRVIRLGAPRPGPGTR